MKFFVRFINETRKSYGFKGVSFRGFEHDKSADAAPILYEVTAPPHWRALLEAEKDGNTPIFEVTDKRPTPRPAQWKRGLRVVALDLTGVPA